MQVEYGIEVSAEITPLEGNVLASGDDGVDMEAEEEIRERLREGEVWAWCSVKVTAKVAEGGLVFEGEAHLGCCSYKDEQDFLRDMGDTMKAEALTNLEQRLESLVHRGATAAKVLKKIRSGKK